MRGLLAICALVLPAVAGAQTVTLSVRPPIVAVGQAADVEVVIEGGGSVSRPTFPPQTAFTLTPRGESSNFELSRGRVVQSSTHSFRLVARQVGEWQVGPATVEIDGRTARSDAVSLRVVAAGAARAEPNGSDTETPRGPSYATTRVVPERAYEGQGVVYVLDVGTSLRTSRVGWEPPDWGGLQAEPLVKQADSSSSRVIDGRQYALTQLLVPLFPVKAGTATISGTTVSLTVLERGIGLFAETREEPVAAPPARLLVLPLPTEGRPADFSGAVGRFALAAAASPRAVDAGGTVTLTLQLAGEGALRGPSLRFAPPDGVRVYDEAPQVQSAIAGEAVQSRAVFKKALVPLKPGELTIPAAEFVYFDPQAAAYVSARSEPIVIRVGGSAVAEPAVIARSDALVQAKAAVEVLGADIFPPRPAAEVIGDARAKLGAAAWIGLVVPALLLGGSAAASARGRGRSTERGRRQAAVRGGADAIRAAAMASSPEDAEVAMRAWLRARLGGEGGAVSPDEAKGLLAARGLDMEFAAEGAALLGALEAARYGMAAGPDLPGRAAAWLLRAQKELQA